MTTASTLPFDVRLVHALENIMNFAPESAVHRAFAKHEIHSIGDLCALSDDQLGKLDAPDTIANAIAQASGVEKAKKGMPLSMGHCNNIRLFIKYILVAQTDLQRDLSKDDEWNKLSCDEYNEYHMKNPLITITIPATTTPTSSLTGTTTTSTTPGMMAPPSFASNPFGKRDMKLDPGWNSWNTTTLAYAKARGLAEVFDPSFVVPATGTYKRHQYDWQQRQVYPIFLDKLKTDVGISITLKYTNGDAHSIYKDLVKHYEASTAAQLTGDALLAYLTSAKFGEVHFDGGTVQFILHWQKQLLLFDNTCTANDRLSEATRKRLLKNAVAPVDELNAIAVTEQIMSTGASSTKGLSDYEHTVPFSCPQLKPTTTNTMLLPADAIALIVKFAITTSLKMMMMIST
jgi:hypothetical protein